MEPNNTPINLDDAIRAMRESTPSAEQAQAAQARVLSSLRTEAPIVMPGRLRTSEDYSALLAPYLRNELSEAQRMLVDDRLQSNVGYRRELDQLQGKVREIAPARRRPSVAASFVPWAVAAGVLFSVGYFALDSIDRMMAPGGQRAEVASVSGQIFKVSAAGLVPAKAGDAIGENEAIRTAKGSVAVVRLPDGSLIEMNERAELSISAAYSGSTVRLDRGNIVVQAAKQKRGALRVATRESTVSVKGTIFAVAAGMRGTQVAVIEGHVVVEQGGKTEDLLPGQATGSETDLKRTTVPDQIAWSKDSVRYTAMLSEISQISKQISALPMPTLRSTSKLLGLLPADTVVYVAIPNISGTVADATKIFEAKLRESPVLQQWWRTPQVEEMRNLAEKLRSAGSQIGDEIVLAASLSGTGGPGHPYLIAEVKNAGARDALQQQLRGMTGMKEAAADNFFITDRFLVAGDKAALAGLRNGTSAEGGFANTPLATTVQKSYAKGAGWILAVDLEQIFAQSVSKKSNDNIAMSLTGINKMRHLMVERRDGAGRSGQSDMRASLNFSSPRTGIVGWLAAPAPMPSLDYVSPEAGFAMSAVTKNARQMAEEFFGGMGNIGGNISEVEQKIGISVINDLAGPLGGEITMALDGPVFPTPTYIFAVEVYDATRLTSTMRMIAQAVNLEAKGAVKVDFTEESIKGQVWYRLKASNVPVELNFIYSNGYLVGAPDRDAIKKALQTRQNLLSLPRSQVFKELLPLDGQVNSSALFYFNLGANLKGLSDTVKGSLPEAQQKALTQFSANATPVLICLYAGADTITVASTSGFFGFGLDTLMTAGHGSPILPQILSSAMGGPAAHGNRVQEKITKQ